MGGLKASLASLTLLNGNNAVLAYRSVDVGDNLAHSTVVVSTDGSHTPQVPLGEPTAATV